MNIDLTKPWKEVFALVAEANAEEKRKKHDDEMQEVLNQRDKDKHVEDDKREKKEEEQKAFEQMLATTDRIADFSSHLNDLDTASVHALMANGEALDRVQVQLGSLLDKADKLPDGRRVFKTEDGTRVFDEHGVEMSPAVVDPHSINDMAPRWEPFKALQEKKHEIEAERHELLAYQEKLDRTRARLDKSVVTNKELDTLEADLKASMPEAVRDQLGHRGAAPSVSNVGLQDHTATAQRVDTIRTAAPPSPGLN